MSEDTLKPYFVGRLTYIDYEKVVATNPIDAAEKFLEKHAAAGAGTPNVNIVKHASDADLIVVDTTFDTGEDIYMRVKEF